MQNKVRSIIEKSSAQLGSILAKVKLINKIQHTLNHYLEAELRDFCMVANYRQGCLILEIENAAIATRIRYQLPSLLKRLRTEGNLPGLSSIDYQIRQSTKVTKKIKNPIVISTKSSQLLQETARYIKHSELSRALLKLSEHST